MIAFTKFIHIIAISIWIGALATLPVLFRGAGTALNGPRKGATGDRMRISSILRPIYVGVASPAAFLAVASGIVLIFQANVTAQWFALKLTLVAGLVVAHSVAGLTVARLSGRDGSYPLWRSIGTGAVIAGLAIAVIGVTLSKPQLTGVDLVSSLSEPGALKELAAPFNPWHRP